MNKIRVVAPVSVALSLGAVIVSCMSFSLNPDNDASAVMTGANGGSSATTGGGGSAVTTGGGGSSATTGGGGSSVTSGSGGSSSTTGGGGSSGNGGSGGSSSITGGGGSGSGGAGGSTAASGPCDILTAAGNTCVAAHSTVRVLRAAYTGPLYQVCKGASAPGPNSCPGGMTKDIGSVAGYADAATQDAFCAGGTCTISIIYDQSGMGNHLRPAPAGGAKASPDNPAVATDLKLTLNGHPAYGVFIKTGLGYRAGCTGCGVTTPHGTATGDQAETEYMVTGWNGLIDGCCFDYGNAETDSHDDGNGTMEAVYFGGGVVWGTGSPGGHNQGTPPNGNPWVMADLENGLYAGWVPASGNTPGSDQAIPGNTPMRFNYATAVVIGDVASQNGGKGRFALYGGDATTGALSQKYDGIRPEKTGYVPMRKQGSIILGIGGDNSDGDGGQWFEGVMASGAATVATLNAVQANIVAAGYGK
jgi:hypothetical protein